MMTTGLEDASLEDASLEGRVASLAASATSDDAAAVRAVIEAYGDRLTAADVPGIISLYTGNAAVMQPGLETTVGIRQLRATYDAFENMRLDFTFRFEDIIVSGDLAAVRTTGQGAITIRGTGETQPARFRELFVLERTGSDWKIAQYMFQQMPEQLGGGCSGIWRLRHTDSGTFRRPLAVIEHDAGAPAVSSSTCSYRGRAGRRWSNRNHRRASFWLARHVGDLTGCPPRQCRSAELTCRLFR